MSDTLRTGKHEIHTRVDAPHAFDGMPESPEPTADLLSSIAGLNKEKSASQLCNQAVELSSHLQKKQRLLERRESELNARLALLDSESRATRLAYARDAARDDSSVPESDEAQTDAQFAEKIRRHVNDQGIALDQIEGEMQQSPRLRAFSDDEPTRSAFVSELGVLDESHRQNRLDAEPDFEAIPDGDSDSLDDRLTKTHATYVTVSDELHESLSLREAKLREREAQVQATHDHVAELHRESIELRMATEQLWNELCQEYSEEEVAHQLSIYRSKLTDHFKMTNDEIARRQKSLLHLQQELSGQEGQLRQQRMDIQVWIDRQRNEIEARSGQLVARELEFSRREAEFQRQSIVWQQQREEYRREIEQLSRRIRASA